MLNLKVVRDDVKIRWAELCRAHSQLTICELILDDLVENVYKRFSPHIYSNSENFKFLHCEGRGGMGALEGRVGIVGFLDYLII